MSPIDQSAENLKYIWGITSHMYQDSMEVQKNFYIKLIVHTYFKTIFSKMHAGFEYCFSAVNECIDLPLLFLVAINF